jgi:DNA topoisomerase-2
VDVDFVLHMDPDAYHEARAYTAEFETRFKLTTKFSTTNMVAFDVNGLLRKFATVGEIMEQFYGERRRAYDARKKHELARLHSEVVELDARLVFVKAVVEKRLVVANAEDDELLAGLKALALPPISAPESEDLRGYEYLLRMRVDRLKAAAVSELEKEVAETKAKYEALAATTVENLWLDDLAAFESAWNAFEVQRKAATEEAAAASSGVVPKKAVIKRRVVAKK